MVYNYRRWNADQSGRQIWLEFFAATSPSTLTWLAAGTPTVGHLRSYLRSGVEVFGHRCRQRDMRESKEERERGGRGRTHEGLPHFGRNMKTAKTAGNSSSESWTRDRGQRWRERQTGRHCRLIRTLKEKKQQLGKTLNITKLLKERQEKEVETSMLISKAQTNSVEKPSSGWRWEVSLRVCQCVRECVWLL